MNKQAISIAILCMVSFIQAYLLVSVFPYAAYMSVFLWNRQGDHLDTDNERGFDDQAQQPQKQMRTIRKLQKFQPTTITVEQAGPYAALLTTSFMVGRTCTAHFWGRLADIYGRRFVLLTSLIGSGWACMWFGMTTGYGGLGGAVVARGVLGGWNSIVGVTKTLATELAFYEFGEETDGFIEELEDADNDASVGGNFNRDRGNDCTEQRMECAPLTSEEVGCTMKNHTGSHQYEGHNPHGADSRRMQMSYQETETIDDHDRQVDHSLQQWRHQLQQQQKIQQQDQMETRIVGLVVGMRAWGFLIAPAIAGYLADPFMVRTHGMDTNTSGNNPSFVYQSLQCYPYLLPNLLGAVMCWVSAVAVYFGIPETRENHYSVRELVSWVLSRFCGLCCRFWEVAKKRKLRRANAMKTARCDNIAEQQHSITSSFATATTATTISNVNVGSYDSIDCTHYNCIGHHTQHGRDHDDDAHHGILVTTGTEEAKSPLKTAPSSGLPIKANSLPSDNESHCDEAPFIINHANSNIRNEIENTKDGTTINQQDPTSLSAIWSRRNTRYHLIAYWLYSLVVISIDEAFPLYCISRNNGFSGMSESDIGTILSCAGVLFALGQYRVYTLIVDRWGVYRSLSLGCWLGVLPVVLIPLASILLVASSSPTFQDVTYSKKYSILYLSIVMGVTKQFQSTFFSSITIATNRTVPKEARSSMNGFASVGAGVAKALGPLVAGFWMAVCLSWDDSGAGTEDEKGILHVPKGAMIAFFGIGSLGFVVLAVLPLLEQVGCR